MTKALRRSPLDALHRAASARMAPFGGWEMPIQFSSVLEEHRACRSDAVVFDVSHLGSVLVEGPGAFAALQWALSNDLGRVEPGRTQYTHLLDPDDAHVVDDIIVWWVAPERFLVMPNASNTTRVTTAIGEAVTHAEGPLDSSDITSSRAVLAVQGPHARERLTGLVDAAAVVPRLRVTDVHEPFDGYAAGTGYTGEDGVELHVPAADAPETWERLVAAGIRPAGLGARDTLRLEAGYPLHGHELGPGVTPLQAGLAWVARFDKGDFRGRAALLAEKERGVTRRLRGLLGDDRRVPRAGCSVAIGGRTVGEVTSGNYSPTLERGIALAFLPPDVADETAVTIDVRGRAVDARVARTPFVSHL
ncbi:MAG TPA: glycine cleavage system aminomethyltransferase GcvT [Acidimicrobiia bacterium]|nr:glycine cleavage system aminomethyltransferase GcvT [Acidimicrobiia bacterium]